MIQRQLFPSVVSFVISILVVGATFSYLDTINPKIEHRTRVLDIFKQDRFTSVFATLILKQVVLFLWGTHPLCREPHQHLRQHSIFGDLRQGEQP